MENNERDLGKVEAHVETLLELVKELKEDIRSISDRVEKLEGELNLYKNMANFVRFTFIAIATALTFKFGDLQGLWQRIMHG